MPWLPLSYDYRASFWGSADLIVLSSKSGEAYRELRPGRRRDRCVGLYWVHSVCQGEADRQRGHDRCWVQTPAFCPPFALLDCWLSSNSARCSGDKVCKTAHGKSSQLTVHTLSHHTVHSDRWQHLSIYSTTHTYIHECMLKFINVNDHTHTCILVLLTSVYV